MKEIEIIQFCLFEDWNYSVLCEFACVLSGIGYRVNRLILSISDIFSKHYFIIDLDVSTLLFLWARPVGPPLPPGRVGSPVGSGRALAAPLPGRVCGTFNCVFVE